MYMRPASENRGNAITRKDEWYYFVGAVFNILRDTMNDCAVTFYIYILYISLSAQRQGAETTDTYVYII
jgi:hypothetical protein